MKVAYIAGPYRAATPSGIYENIHRARQVALKYWLKGYAVICTHMNTSFFDGAAPDSIWLEGDIEILRKCDVLVAMDTWVNSSGAKAEVRFALDNNIEVIYDQRYF